MPSDRLSSPSTLSRYSDSDLSELEFMDEPEYIHTSRGKSERTFIANRKGIPIKHDRYLNVIQMVQLELLINKKEWYSYM